MEVLFDSVLLNSWSYSHRMRWKKILAKFLFMELRFCDTLNHVALFVLWISIADWKQRIRPRGNPMTFRHRNEWWSQSFGDWLFGFGGHKFHHNNPTTGPKWKWTQHPRGSRLLFYYKKANRILISKHDDGFVIFCFKCLYKREHTHANLFETNIFKINNRIYCIMTYIWRKNMGNFIHWLPGEWQTSTIGLIKRKIYAYFIFQRNLLL